MKQEKVLLLFSGKKESPKNKYLEYLSYTVLPICISQNKGDGDIKKRVLEFFLNEGSARPLPMKKLCLSGKLRFTFAIKLENAY